jgi:hypothetical protein
MERKERNMNFIDAVKAAVDGKTIKLKSWRTGSVTTDPKIMGVKYLVCASDYSNAFIATDDMLADDWEIVPAEPPKEIRLMDFKEAMARVKEGKTVRRKNWVHHVVCKSVSGWWGIDRVTKTKDVQYARQYIPDFDDIEATDWVVVEKGGCDE